MQLFSTAATKPEGRRGANLGNGGLRFGQGQAPALQREVEKHGRFSERSKSAGGTGGRPILPSRLLCVDLAVPEIGFTPQGHLFQHIDLKSHRVQKKHT